MLDPSLVRAAEERIERFPEEYRAIGTLIDLINQIIGLYQDKMSLRTSQPERDLDLLVAASFGKAGKTFQAINTLCAFGFGEDALIALRANINLMINLSYILSDDSLIRSGDFIAYSHQEQMDYLKTAHETVPASYETLDWNDIKERAARWRSLGINERAKKSRQRYHYCVGYKFYSSIEHSDAWSLSQYIAEWDEIGPKIGSAPSDKYVDIAFHHNFWIMANVLSFFCRHFNIDEPQIFAKLDEEWEKLSKDVHIEVPATSASELQSPVPEK